MVTKISYRRSYVIGPYLQEQVGFEYDLPVGDDPIEAMEYLKELADESHKTNNPHIEQSSPETSNGIPATIDLNQERMEIAIDNCMCENELKQWKEANPVIPVPILKHYNTKLKELTQ